MTNERLAEIKGTPHKTHEERDLIAEIDRLRAENTNLRRAIESWKAEEQTWHEERKAAAGAWQDFDEDSYPEDETEVLWLEKFNNGRGWEYKASVERMSRRRGCYGPSHAVAFAEIKMPEEPKS